jgi:hypothetical protein
VYLTVTLEAYPSAAFRCRPVVAQIAAPDDVGAMPADACGPSAALPPESRGKPLRNASVSVALRYRLTTGFPHGRARFFGLILVSHSGMRLRHIIPAYSPACSLVSQSFRHVSGMSGSLNNKLVISETSRRLVSLERYH